MPKPLSFTAAAVGSSADEFVVASGLSRSQGYASSTRRFLGRPMGF